MKLDHIAIWTTNLEKVKEYYIKYFNAKANDLYVNNSNGFKSYFLSFDSGARMEIMYKPDIPDNLNSCIEQYKGIIHLAFDVETMEDVDKKAKELQADGYKILKGPRKTGDGYYEFETIDPENNRLEVIAKFTEK
ncbi:MAG: VOC family protein [Dysgonomonas sp.]